MLGSTSSWARERLVYDDAWWDAQYAKIYDTPACQDAIPSMEKIKEFDRELDLLKAPRVWALGLYYEKGVCADPAPDQAIAILTDLAERGEGIATVYLAHFHHIKFGANAPLTLAWMERAKNAMSRIIAKNWRKTFYQSRADAFQKIGTPFSPQLEHIFSWGEEILNGDPEIIYKFGINLLEHGKNSEDKVLGCRWLYKAMNKGHAQARYRFARQMLLGDGVMQVPSDAFGYLYSAVNRDHNLDAILFVSQLLEKGGLFKRSLPDAYIALLRARNFGAIVADDDLSRLRNQLTKGELYWAEKDAVNMKMSIFFTLTPQLAALDSSGIASRTCKFVP